MVVDYLSSNYDAIAQTSNLLAEWLLMADISIAEVQTLVEETLKKMIIKYFDPKKADSIFSDETRGVRTREGDNTHTLVLNQTFFFFTHLLLDARLAHRDDHSPHLAQSDLQARGRLSRVSDA